MSNARAIVTKLVAAGAPRIGFGTGDMFRGGNSEKLVRSAYDAGFRYFDTARLYGDGQAEHVLGNALAGLRDKVVIASKAGIIPWSMQTGRRIAAKAGRLVGRNINASERYGAFSRGDIIRSVEASLRALRTDYLDILLLHECSLVHVTSDKTTQAVENLIRDGKIRAQGIATSFERTDEILRDGRIQPAIVQGPSDAINGQVPSYRGDEDRLIITHSAMRPVLNALKTNPAATTAQLRAIGIDADDRAHLPANLVAHAVASNPDGLTLVSTLKSERLAGLISASRAPRPAALSF